MGRSCRCASPDPSNPAGRMGSIEGQAIQLLLANRVPYVTTFSFRVSPFCSQWVEESFPNVVSAFQDSRQSISKPFRRFSAHGTNASAVGGATWNMPYAATQPLLKPGAGRSPSPVSNTSPPRGPSCAPLPVSAKANRQMPCVPVHARRGFSRDSPEYYAPPKIA